MFAIAIALVFFLYLSICALLIWLVWKNAKKYGYSGKKWSVAVGLLLIGIVFWDWLPMEILFRHKCANNAGFFQEITIDEWKAQNPGVWETLSFSALPEEYFVKEKLGRKRSKRRFYQLPDGTELIARYNNVGDYLSTKVLRNDGLPRYRLNQRFIWETVWTKHYFHLRESEERIVDFKSGEVLARYVDFGTNIPPIGIGGSNIGDYKFWMYKRSCVNDSTKSEKIIFKDLENKIRDIGK
ncbi:MAG: hypothetical protein JAY62_14285 [Candidatus Thiodiazotropha endolucinida]|nr:hypothetical protein [Candidatus Thiodiazotropha taylori]MCW4276294.1 hypothetical protein [Candidatus Thiodiazotropha taylori]